MKNIVQKLLHSVPFVVYISMLVLSLAGFHFPKSVYTLYRDCGHRQPFLSMLMIGMMFEIKLDKRQWLCQGAVQRALCNIALVRRCFYLSGAFQAGDKLCDCAGVYGTLHDYRPDFCREVGSKCTAGQPVQFIDDYYQRCSFYSFFHYNKRLIDVGLDILV